MVCALDCHWITRSEFDPWPEHCVAFFMPRHLTRIVLLSAQVYKWVRQIKCWGQPCNGLASLPGKRKNTLSPFILATYIETVIRSGHLGHVETRMETNVYPRNFVRVRCLAHSTMTLFYCSPLCRYEGPLLAGYFSRAISFPRLLRTFQIEFPSQTG